MAPTFIANANSGSATTTALNVAYTPTGNTLNNFLVAVLRLPFGAGNTYTVFDSLGNPWAKLLDFAQTGDRYQLWYVLGCKAGANTVTAESVPQASTFFRMIVAEYSGVAMHAAVAFDGQNSAIGTSNAVSSGSITTVNATDLIIGFTADQTRDTGGFSPTSGFTTRRSQDGNLFLSDLIVSSTGTYSFTGTLSNSDLWGAGIAAFTASSATNPYEGYGALDSGGVALPAQEPTPINFAAQTNSINQIAASGGRGPTNLGVLYQSGGGGNTPGDGQIFPSGRS